ncbi:MAG: hypothetical protein Q4F41_01595 [Eubacteriales bacterium]|nr:hypothetical protein [Eubacteriales bacterium]
MKYAEKNLYDPRQDEKYRKPQIDSQEIRVRETAGGQKLSYHHVHGSFAETGVKFLFCIPQKEAYEGRFFQHLSPFPGPDEENAALEKTGEEDFIAFSLTHGAAYVESNMGAAQIFETVSDSRIFYRSSAAVAEYFRDFVQELYGAHRVYGYVFGGSGGGYKTMSCIENTAAWDGAVPFVIGSPMSLPNCLTVAAHGSRLLRHCWKQIVDALEPGGSGDIYEGLNEEEKEALQEICRMGFPPRVCAAFEVEDDGSLPVLTPVVQRLDPTYFTDFWTKPGYLGTEPGSSAARDRIHLHTTITGFGIQEAQKEPETMDGRNGTDDAWQKMLTDAGSSFLEVEEVPQGEDLFLRGVDILFETGNAAGKKLRLKKIVGNRLIPGMSYGADDFGEVIRMVKKGDKILLDNSDYLAIQTYHRHQVPEDRSFHAWDQYRDESGKPRYPQRDSVIAFGFTEGGCGSVQDGRIQGKVIVMNSLMDGDFPWQADWYRKKVAEIYGTQAEDCFRLWYNDNCPHGDVSEGGDPLRVVSYLGMLQQALLDVAKWAEKGIAPVASSGYRLVENQVVLEETSEKRGGIQPMVRLLAQGGTCARVKAGQKVSFKAEIELPKGAGVLKSVEWSFEGETDYACGGTSAEAEHVYQKPGTYFAVVRVTTSRNPEDSFARLRNLSRVRVIVEE